jgi:uncharacterized cupredoxin-like copper-binding protein
VKESMIKNKPWLVLAGVVVTLFSLAFLSAACDDDGDDNGSGATPEDTSPTATVPADEGDSPTATESAEEHEDESTSVGASLADDFTLTLDADTAAHGEVVFNVTNDGPALPHSLQVVKTDEAPDGLPVDAGQVDESAVDVVASTTADLNAGEAEDVTAELEAGSYVVLCNVVGHYQAGMFTTFTVE